MKILPRLVAGLDRCYDEEATVLSPLQILYHRVWVSACNIVITLEILLSSNIHGDIVHRAEPGIQMVKAESGWYPSSTQGRP